MSRSYKKTPIGGWGSTTAQKKFKQQEHRRERAAIRSSILNDILPHPKQFGNEWNSPRDGKGWFGWQSTELMRK